MAGSLRLFTWLMVKRIRAIIQGKVQGVYYRASARGQATELGLEGFVRNLTNGSVELEAEGEESKLEELLRWCQIGPPGSRVDRIELVWLSPQHKGEGFSIVR